MAINVKTLRPEERRLMITNLEKIIADCRAQVTDLRVACHPHQYELSESKIMVNCVGCGESHLYRPEFDVLCQVDLPTIQKAP